MNHDPTQERTGRVSAPNRADLPVDRKREFFDGLAERWDGLQPDRIALREQLAAGLRDLGVGDSETVLDVGCGTGNLTRALLDRLSPAGRVVAVDISPRMLEVASRKIDDPRVRWLQADAVRLDLDPESFDRVLCFCVWPHFDNGAAVACEFRRLLRRAGSLHIWHPIPRERVNEIHTEAGEAVHGDLLAPAGETAKMLAGLGFKVKEVIDDEHRYLVSAVKPAG